MQAFGDGDADSLGFAARNRLRNFGRRHAVVQVIDTEFNSPGFAGDSHIELKKHFAVDQVCFSEPRRNIREVGAGFDSKVGMPRTVAYRAQAKVHGSPAYQKQRQQRARRDHERLSYLLQIILQHACGYN